MHDELANSIDLIGTQLKERMSSLKDLIETQTKSTADTNVLDEIKDSIKKLTEKMENTLNKIYKIEESMK